MYEHSYYPRMAACAGCGQVPVINSRGQVVDRHDCAYVQVVNGLLDEAADAADRSLGLRLATGGVRGNVSEAWDATYHRAVDRITRERGVR